MLRSPRPPDEAAGGVSKRLTVRRGRPGERPLKARGGPRQINLDVDGRARPLANGLDDRPEAVLGDACSPRKKSFFVAGVGTTRRSSVVLGGGAGKPPERESGGDQLELEQLKRSHVFLHHLTISGMPASGTDELKTLLSTSKMPKLPIPSRDSHHLNEGAWGAHTDRQRASIFPDLSHLRPSGAQTARRTRGTNAPPPRVLFSRSQESDAPHSPLYDAVLNAAIGITRNTTARNINTAQNRGARLPKPGSKGKGDPGFGALSPWAGGQGVW
ncbi:hypothetical protein T484DRAFT_1922354 [Baffinella frigidus]|nr:hypothetical protein T484DRAFT_1922354 [Cryptophyta sp. CCMP2293]